MTLYSIYKRTKHEQNIFGIEEIMNLEIKSYQDYPSYYGKILKSNLYKKSIKFIKSFIWVM